MALAPMLPQDVLPTTPMPSPFTVDPLLCTWECCAANASCSLAPFLTPSFQTHSTDSLLTVLQEQGVNATFFVRSALVPPYAATVQRIAASGHVIGR